MALTLKYWNGRGLMEPARMVLAIAGKFPGADYTDGRFNEPAGELAANLGRMPIAQVGDDYIGQSSAIYYYVAAENGLLGEGNLEAAQIISIFEHLRELIQAFRSLGEWGKPLTEEAAHKWFEEGATDVSGPADGSNRQRYLKWFAGRIEAALGNHGFAVGKKLSLADVLLYYTFADHLRDEEASADFPKHRREPFGDKARTDALLEKHPKIKASIEAVAANPNFQKWLATRGVQGF